MIRLENVFVKYGRRMAVADVSLQLDPGEVTLLLGANGAGKSTLLRCLLGISSFEGEIRVAGLNPLTDGVAVRAMVGYMPQSGGLHNELTVMETVRLYAAIRRVRIERGESLLAEAGLAAHAMTKVGDLSGGMRQRLGFALALLPDPGILVLDEPSASLDASSRAWLAAKLRAAAAEGRTVLVSTHAGQDLLSAADRRIVLEDGCLVSDDRIGATTSTRSPRQQTLSGGSVLPLTMKELKDAFTNRWLVTYAVLLGLLGMAAATTGIHSSSGLALQAFGRTTATLMNLCLLLSPLVAVLMGASSITSERDRGTLEHLLAQPLSRASILLGKHVGLLISLTTATLVGFLPAGLLIVWHGGSSTIAHYLLFPAIASLAGAAMLAIGVFLSVASRTGAQSQGAAVFAWFAFVLLYDLVLIGVLAMTGMPVALLSAALVANPVDGARVLGVLSLEPDLYLLGPAGSYLTSQLSRTGTAVLLFSALFVWSTLPVAAAVGRFSLPRPRGVFLLSKGRAVMLRRLAMLTVMVGALGLLFGCSHSESENHRGDRNEKHEAREAEKADANVSPAVLEQGRGLYKAHCVACHGDSGRGDGPAAGVMKPPPRDHTDRAYMSTLTDKQIADIIKMGGALKGKPLMPSHPQFKEAQLSALVAYVRSMSKPLN